MSRREKILLMILFLLAGGYVYYQFLLSPLQSRIYLLAGENGRLTARIAAMEQKSRQQEGTAISEDEIDLRLGKLMEKIPNNPYIPEVIAFMEHSAEESEVSLLEASLEMEPPSSAVQSDPGQPRPVYQYQTLNITVQGSYEALFLYIDKIENRAARIFNIVGVHLKVPVQHFPIGDSASTDTISLYVYDQNRITAAMKIRVFYENQNF